MLGRMPSPAADLPVSLTIDAARRLVSLDPREPAFVQDPYPAYHAIRGVAPVFRWEHYGHWCFARHDHVSALLRDRRFGRQILHLASRDALGWAEPPEHLAPFLAFERHSLLELEPPEHTRLRTLVNRPFLKRIGPGLVPVLERIAHECLDAMPHAGATDLIAHYATPIPVRAITHVLGVPESIGTQMLAWSHDMVAMYQARRDAAVELAAVRATQAFDACVRELLEARRREPGEDLLSELLRSEVSGERLTDDELATTVMLFLIAGHEATVHAIGNGVRALLLAGIDPRARLADPAAAALLVEELLRFDPPLHLFTRFALEDCEVAGVHLRRGETVGLLLGSAGRDPERFDAPDRLDLSRAPNPHVSFGGGLHFCLGAPLARLELQVAYRVLFERMPQLALCEPPRFRDAYHFRGLEALHVRG